MENLDDYILEFKNYQEGSYEFGTLTTEEDITKAIENGKKIVFINNKIQAKIGLILGGMIIIIGFILGIILPEFELWEISKFASFVGFFGLTGTIGLIILIIGLLSLRTSYFVLGREVLHIKKCMRKV